MHTGPRVATQYTAMLATKHRAACGNQMWLRSAMTLSIMKENRWTSPGATHNPLREASAVTGNSGTGRVWQHSTPPHWQPDTGRVWQYSTPPRWQSVLRVAGSTQGVSWSCAAAHGVRVKTQPRGANTCQLQPAPCMAIHAGNQCRVWQPTLATKHRLRVAKHAGNSAVCGKHAGNSAACGNRYPPLTLAEGADARQEIPGG